jgi:hypothetical protein
MLAKIFKSGSYMMKSNAFQNTLKSTALTQFGKKRRTKIKKSVYNKELLRL